MHQKKKKACGGVTCNEHTCSARGGREFFESSMEEYTYLKRCPERDRPPAPTIDRTVTPYDSVSLCIKTQRS